MSLFAPGAAYVAPPTPYAGLTPEGVPAVSAPHVLVVGPSGVGKSRRVLAPGAVMWRGPVVAVSSKPDLIDLCLELRLGNGGRNRTFVLDLSGEVPDETLPEGAHKVVVDPCVLVRSDDDALDLASVLMQSGAAGAGGGTGKGGGDPFWESISVAPLAAILRAAGQDGIAWARAAVSRVDPPSATDVEAPCWANAIGRLDEMGSTILSDELASAMALDPKMRDSVGVTMKSAVSPWLRSTVVGRGTEVPFEPDMLAHPAATLFVVAPATGVAAGAAVAAVDFISKRWRANQTEEVKLPRLLLVVDEVANTMPWPKLPTVVTESRAMGIHLLIACQATSQFAKRYGKEGMDELREIFPAVLLLVGAPEKEMVEKAAWWSLPSDKQTENMDHLGRGSQQSQRAETIAATELLPRHKGEGRLLRGSRPGVEAGERINETGLMVRLVDMSQIDFG